MSTNAYNAKNVFTLVFVFAMVVWLLYSLGTYFHKTLKFHAEVEAIELQNTEMAAEIIQKQRYIEYLKTPQRIDKEAKTQLGRKQAGEQVLVFVDERPELLQAVSAPAPEDITLELTILEKWALLLLPQE